MGKIFLIAVMSVAVVAAALTGIAQTTDPDATQDEFRCEQWEFTAEIYEAAAEIAETYSEVWENPGWNAEPTLEEHAREINEIYRERQDTGQATGFPPELERFMIER